MSWPMIRSSMTEEREHVPSGMIYTLLCTHSTVELLLLAGKKLKDFAAIHRFEGYPSGLSPGENARAHNSKLV
ncbi:hypothetical protein Csa_011435 [Cucumis sativus]|nr:hypothetical protein Csa_011435 [Cucumis sativus]